MATESLWISWMLLKGMVTPFGQLLNDLGYLLGSVTIAFEFVA